jgi:hypothetical protein
LKDIFSFSNWAPSIAAEKDVTLSCGGRERLVSFEWWRLVVDL